MKDRTQIRVEYLVYINKTKKIESKFEWFDYIKRPNWFKHCSDFSAIKRNLQKDHKSTDIIWISKIEVHSKQGDENIDGYKKDFRDALARRGKTVL